MSSFAIPDVATGHPGTRTRPATSSRDLHDPYVETGGPASFLTLEQRGRQVAKYQQRVMSAADAFYAGLGAVQLAEALKDEPDVDMFTSLIIDALTTVTGGAVKLAAAAVRAGMGVPAGASTEDASKGDESVVSYVLKGALDAGKKAGKSAAKNGSEFDRDRNAATSFLDQLGSNAALAFQHLREDPPGVLGDAELVMATETMDAAKGHNNVMYAAKIREVLARFRASTASKIGRTDRRVHGEQPIDIAERGDIPGAIRKNSDSVIRDTKLVLHTYTDGTPSMLFYYVRDYDMPFNAGGEHDETVDISMFAEGGWKPSHRVEDEFAEAAMAANRRAWKVSHETKEIGSLPDGPAIYTDPTRRPTTPSSPATPAYRPPIRRWK